MVCKAAQGERRRGAETADATQESSRDAELDYAPESAAFPNLECQGLYCRLDVWVFQDNARYRATLRHALYEEKEARTRKNRSMRDLRAKIQIQAENERRLAAARLRATVEDASDSEEDIEPKRNGWMRDPRAIIESDYRERG
jgi:hypothetical protein